MFLLIVLILKTLKSLWKLLGVTQTPMRVTSWLLRIKGMSRMIFIFIFFSFLAFVVGNPWIM